MSARHHCRSARAPALVTIVLVAVLVAALMATGGGAEAAAGRTFHAAPGGAAVPGDCSGGTEEAPWGSVKGAMDCLEPGDTLLLRDGTFDERVSVLATPATPDQPILVSAYPGERPVIRGILRVERPDHWVFDGVNVTGDDGHYAGGDFPVKLRGGTGWVFRNAEVWNANAFAALRVEESAAYGPARHWRLVGNCVHTTHPTHGTNTDHNVYVDPGPGGGPGVIERNIFFNAPNGQNLKLGPGSVPSVASNITVKFNTMWGGVQNVLANRGSHDLNVHRNILGGVVLNQHWYPNIRGHSLTGARNIAANNLGHGTTRVIFNDLGSTTGWIDGGGNVLNHNPVFSGGTSSCSGFIPQSAFAQRYGHLAAEATPRPTTEACPAGLVPDAGFSDVPASYAHVGAIDCAAWWALAGGFGDDAYRPSQGVSRAHMATFITNLILESGGSLPPAPATPEFADLGSSPHAENIERLAAAGIVSGTGPSTFSPGQAVRRAQMATFLVEAYKHITGETLPVTGDYFVDDDGSPHEANINRAADAGLAAGNAFGAYAPRETVRRGPMASFLIRLADLLVTEGLADPPSD